MGKLIKSLSKDKNIRYYVVDTTDIIKQIQKRHKPSFESLIALAKVATFATLYGPSILATNEEVTIKINGNGKMGTIYCDVNWLGDVKIMATNMHEKLELQDGKFDFNSMIGTNGTIQVIKDLKMRENYNAISPILNKDITESFSYFMQISEQKPSAIGVGLNFDQNQEVLKCGGFMAQMLPNATDKNYQTLEKNIKMLPNTNILFKEFNDLEIVELISQNDYKIIQESQVEFKCNCNKQRFLDKIILLGEKQIQEIFKNKEQIEVICEFCKNEYIITKEEVNEK